MPRAIEITDPVDLLVGERLRAERIHKGWSQTQLGHALNVSFQQVQKYERGINRVSASTLFHAAQILDVPVSDLYPDDGVRRPVEPDAAQGEAELVQHFAIMDADCREVLLKVARQLARVGRSGRRPVAAA